MKLQFTSIASLCGEETAVAASPARRRRFPPWRSFARWMTEVSPALIGGDGAAARWGMPVPSWRKLAAVLGDADRIRAGVPADATAWPAWTLGKHARPLSEEVPAWQ